MPDLVLRSFQSLERVAQLQRSRALRGDWTHVLRGNENAYARMVEVMTEQGIDTGGRPPVWAWHGALRLLDADLLFDAEEELSKGFATVTFCAPDHLVLLSDYADWCDLLMAPPETPVDQWRPRPHIAGSLHPEQACLPYLLMDWVTDIQPLPTTDWNDLDLDAPL